MRRGSTNKEGCGKGMGVLRNTIRPKRTTGVDEDAKALGVREKVGYRDATHVKWGKVKLRRELTTLVNRLEKRGRSRGKH